MTYYQKYLKYKNKYIDLKNIIESEIINNNDIINNNTLINMDGGISENFNDNDKIIINTLVNQFFNDNNYNNNINKKINEFFSDTVNLNDYSEILKLVLLQNNIKNVSIKHSAEMLIHKLTNINNNNNNNNNNSIFTHLYNYFINNKNTTKITKDTQINNKWPEGPTETSNWVRQNILIGGAPRVCDDIHKIKESGITLVLSLRESNELYQYCVKNSIIYWRFRIEDYNTPPLKEDLKSLIDNLINYLESDPIHKIMIHCEGGHGRTGTVVLSLLSFYFINTEIYKNRIQLINNYDFVKTPNIKQNIINIENEITNLSQDIFNILQLYLILCLRLFRISDQKKNINSIKVPETHIQEKMVKEIIKMYIKDYNINGYVIIPNNNLQNVTR